ncbi:MAG TPA: DUF397 domain-containing protein [Streptosporangiaceae bacterium]|jgi:hypothetical protein|nr:DUF397 domain-containing protein [Streptosporangiaceae bacterium]
MNDTFNWRKSSYSAGQGNCVEVTHNSTGAIAIRDSKNPGGHLVLSRGEWQTFTEQIKVGQLG